MSDSGKGWSQGDAWQGRGQDPWSTGKGRVSTVTRQLFYYNEVSFKGHGDTTEWMMEFPPGTAISDPKATMSREEHGFNYGNIPWVCTLGPPPDQFRNSLDAQGWFKHWSEYRAMLREHSANTDPNAFRLNAPGY